MKYFVKQNDGVLVPRRRTRDELNAKFGNWDRFLVGQGLGSYDEKKHAWYAYRSFRFRRRFGKHVGCWELKREYRRTTDSDEDSGSVFFIDV